MVSLFCEWMDPKVSDWPAIFVMFTISALIAMFSASWDLSRNSRETLEMLHRINHSLRISVHRFEESLAWQATTMPYDMQGGGMRAGSRDGVLRRRMPMERTEGSAAAPSSMMELVPRQFGEVEKEFEELFGMDAFES